VIRHRPGALRDLDRRILATWAKPKAKLHGRRRAPGRPSYHWVLEVALGLLVIRPAL
jgi:hypothetical protein